MSVTEAAVCGDALGFVPAVLTQVGVACRVQRKALGEGTFVADFKYDHNLIGICVVLSSRFFTVCSVGIF